MGQGTGEDSPRVFPEKPRTFSERESKFTVKFFALQFFAHFSSLVYIAFILGRWGPLSACFPQKGERLRLLILKVTHTQNKRRCVTDVCGGSPPGPEPRGLPLGAASPSVGLSKLSHTHMLTCAVNKCRSRHRTCAGGRAGWGGGSVRCAL